jgi:hypothetical protein
MKPFLALTFADAVILALVLIALGLLGILYVVFYQHLKTTERIEASISYITENARERREQAISGEAELKSRDTVIETKAQLALQQNQEIDIRVRDIEKRIAFCEERLEAEARS